MSPTFNIFQLETFRPRYKTISVMITVKVRLFATLARLLPELGIGQFLPVDLPDSSTLDSLADRLELPETRLIFVNGIARLDNHFLLQDGDEIAVFPPLGGG